MAMLRSCSVLARALPYEEMTVAAMDRLDDLGAEWLRHQWQDKCRTAAEIGEEVGLSTSAIHRRLKKWDISRRSHPEIVADVVTRDELREWYWGQELGLIAIAERVSERLEFTVKFGTIAVVMDQWKIPKRQKGQEPIAAPPEEELRQAFLEEKLSYWVMAERFRVSVDTVGRWIGEAGLERGRWWVANPAVERPTREELKELVVDQDLPFEEVARRWSVSSTTVRRWMNQDGLEVDTAGRSYGCEHITNDGHVVRSGYELAVDNWLSDHNLAHEYEPLLPWAEGRSRQLADFRVGDVWIEVFGVTDVEAYSQKTLEKIELYGELDLPLIALYPDDFQGDPRWRQKLAEGLKHVAPVEGNLVIENERPKPTPQELSEHLHEDGLSAVDVAELYGFHSSAVYRWARGWGIDLPRREKPDREALERMYLRERMTIEEIVEKTGWSETIISRRLRRFGIPTKQGPRRRLPPPPAEDLRRMYVDQGMTTREIAATTGVSTTTVGKWMKEIGLPTRYPGPRRKR